MFKGDASLGGGKQRVVVPDVIGEEQLQRPHRAPAGQGDRLDALAGQVADEPAAIGAQVNERFTPGKAPAKRRKKPRKRRPQASNLLRSHRRVTSMSDGGITNERQRR